VEITGKKLIFEGKAVNLSTAKDVVTSIRHGLPAAYGSTENVTVSEDVAPAKEKSGPTQ
jgi:hypothetical protein